ncbi:MAG: AMP-binding protein [Burkholderiales bacterium]|nr:AMP-binding protein [Burkholderiales bacterium]
MERNHWHDYPVAAMRREARFGDRLVRTFAARPPSVHAMLEAAVAAHGARDALVFEGARWSYRALDAEAGRVAAGLAARGVRQGDRVVLYLSNCPEFLFALYALQRLGAIAVPVSVREQRPGLEYIVNQCGARLIVHDQALAERVPAAGACPSVVGRVAVGDAGDFALLRSHGSIDAAAAVAEEDTALILYTSGTTGRPKGAMLTHFNITHSVMHFEACMRLTPADRSVLVVPASHVTGVLAIIATMLRVAGAVVMMREFKAADFLAAAARERITHAIMVPAMYNLMLLQPDFAAHDLSAWRVGGYGGAPMPVATIDALAARLPNLILTNAYGATETTSPVTIMPQGDTRDHADSIGAVVPCGEVLVVDDNGVEVPRGETGELWIGGPMIVKGYWDNPEATAREFTAGYWHSGDLGSIDADGYVRIFDRKKDMLNRGGYKIYSVEVENALMGYPGVVEAAVIGRPCPVLGERVHAVVHAPGRPVDAQALRAFCAERLADYKVPETVAFSATPLPRNANGKLMKRLLRDGLPAAS